MSRHPDPPARDIVGFLAIFCAIGIVADLIIRDWPLVSAWLAANTWALVTIILVCMLAIAALIVGSALRRREP